MYAHLARFVKRAAVKVTDGPRAFGDTLETQSQKKKNPLNIQGVR